jgi:hypothetical protein
MLELRKVLKTMWDLQTEIIMFLEISGKPMFSQLKDENWKKIICRI